MMGRQRRDQGRLFYEFRLEDRIPTNHLLRRMNVFVTVALGELHKELEPHYSEIGRPSIDPELMIRMLIVGYCYGIRSERRLCEEVAAAPGLSLVSLGGHGLSTPFAPDPVGNVRPDAFMLLCVLGVG